MTNELNSFRSREWERERERIERESEPTNVGNERLPRSDSFNSLYAGGPQASGNNRDGDDDEDDDDDEDQIIQAPILRSVSKSKEVSIDKDTNFYTYISSGVGGGRSNSMDPLRSMGSNRLDAPDGFRVNIPSMYSKDSEKVKAESATANVNLDEKLPDVEQAQRRREMRRLSRQQSLDRTSSGVSGISRRASGVSGVRVSTITLDDSDDDEKVATPTRFKDIRRTSSLQQDGQQHPQRDGSRGPDIPKYEAAVNVNQDKKAPNLQDLAAVMEGGGKGGVSNLKSEDVFKLTDDLDEFEKELLGDTQPPIVQKQEEAAIPSQSSQPPPDNKSKKVQLSAETLAQTESQNFNTILDSTKSEFERMVNKEGGERVIQKIIENSAFQANETEPTTPSPKHKKEFAPKIDEKEFAEEEVENKDDKVILEKRLPSAQLPKIKTKVEENVVAQEQIPEKTKVNNTEEEVAVASDQPPKINNKNTDDNKNIEKIEEKIVPPPTLPNLKVKTVAESPKKPQRNQEQQYLNKINNEDINIQDSVNQNSQNKKLQEKVSIEVDSTPVVTSVVGAVQLPSSKSNIAQKGISTMHENSNKSVNNNNVPKSPSLKDIVQQKRINSDTKGVEGAVVQQEKIHTMGSISRMIDEGSGFGGRGKTPMAKVPEDKIPVQTGRKYQKQFSMGEQSLMDQLTNHKPWGESRNMFRANSMLDRNDSIEAQGAPYNPPSTINEYQYTTNSHNPYSGVQLRAAAGEYMSGQNSGQNSNNPYAGVSLRSAAKSYLSQPANSSSQNVTRTTPVSHLDRSTSNISDYSETASSSGSSKVRGISDRFGGSVVGTRSERRSTAMSTTAATPKLDLAKIRSELRSRQDMVTVSMPCSPTSVSKASEIGPYPSAHSTTGPARLTRSESLCIDSNGRKWRYLVRAESTGLMRPVQFTPRAAKPLWMRSERERRRRVAAEARRKWNMSDYAQQLQNVPRQPQVVDSDNTAAELERAASTAKFGRTLSKFKVLEETELADHASLLEQVGRTTSRVGDKLSQLEQNSAGVKQSEARERVRRAYSTKSQIRELREEAMRAINDE